VTESTGGEPSRLTRLGAVSYLNTRPLVFGLETHDEVRVRFDVPARCADLLEGGLIDLGLIPAFEYARHADYLGVPGVAIASCGAVESVALFTRRDIAEVRSIALDTSSRTSANLVRVLCAEHFHIDPVFTPAAPDLGSMLDTADAALVIGDPALFADPALLAGAGRLEAGGAVNKIDLGEVWTQLTGLPFVWAFWAGRADAAPPAICRLLRETRDRGVAAIGVIAQREAPGDAARQALIARYLQRAIAYDLDGPFLDGLRTFYRLLEAHRLIDRPADLRLFEAG
jgi:chorismate dehydratase